MSSRCATRAACISSAAAHVGRALVPVLATVGFRVVMYDNREELAKKENYPMASEVIFGSFSDISGKVALTANDYAVVMTPGPSGGL